MCSLSELETNAAAFSLWAGRAQCPRLPSAHSSMPSWRGEGMTGTRARAAHGQRLLAMELPPPWTPPEGGHRPQAPVPPPLPS
jgi:hypothetical protein